jgi:hypothetical protein
MVVVKHQFIRHRRYINFFQSLQARIASEADAPLNPQTNNVLRANLCILIQMF